MSHARPSDMREALQAVLEDMRLAVDQLAGALEAERDAIEQQDSHSLDQAGARKRTLMQQLEALDVERQQLLRETPSSASQAIAWTDILQRLRECHQLNQRNGSAVHQRLAQIRAALSVLTGHAGEGGLYGRAGQLRASLRSQVLAEA